MEKDLKTLYEVLLALHTAETVIRSSLEDIEDARKKLTELVDKLNS